MLGLSPPGAGRGRSQAIATYEKERRCDGGGQACMASRWETVRGRTGGPLDVLCVGLKSVTLNQYRQSTVCDSKCTSCVHACGLYTVAAGSTQGFP